MRLTIELPDDIAADLLNKTWAHEPTTWEPSSFRAWVNARRHATNLIAAEAARHTPTTR